MNTSDRETPRAGSDSSDTPAGGGATPPERRPLLRYVGLDTAALPLTWMVGGATRWLAQPRATSPRAVRRRLTRPTFEIRRGTQRHLGEVRYGYERALEERPDLEGSVAVQYVVSPTGVVQTAAVSESDVDFPPIETCITSADLHREFPDPEGGGTVLVNHAFVLTLEDP